VNEGATTRERLNPKLMRGALIPTAGINLENKQKEIEDKLNDKQVRPVKLSKKTKKSKFNKRKGRRFAKLPHVPQIILEDCVTGSDDIGSETRMVKICQ
jgi:hypothetical protein